MEAWRATPKGHAALARAARWRSLRQGQGRAGRGGGANTIFLQAVKVASPAWQGLHGTDVHPDQMELLRVRATCFC